jgi:hypothetical protein
MTTHFHHRETEITEMHRRVSVLPSRKSFAAWKGFFWVFLGAHSSCVRRVRHRGHAGSVRSQGRNLRVLCVSAVRFFGWGLGCTVFLRALRLSVVSAVLALSGCSTKQEKQSNASSLRPVAAHGTDAGVKFTAPSGWIQETPSSSMRVAQYRLPRDEGDPEDAEMVVFYFQGQGGSVQANIDRWIGQFIKADGSPASDVARVTRKDSGGIPLSIVDVSGTYTGSGGPMTTTARPKPDFRMLAAVAETSGGPYFFKLTGPVKTVTKWESSFHAFLNSIQ